MANYVLTGMAERDVENIAQYSLEEFGLAQAEKYLSGLHQARCLAHLIFWMFKVIF